MKATFTVILLVSMATSASAQAQSASETQTVVFVCEHGTVKSVIALAYFEQLARDARLPFRAVSRGTAPDSALPAFMRIGLRRDGLDLGAFVPSPLTDQDLATAALVVSFDQPDVAQRTRLPVQAWDGLPSVSASYGNGRDAIKQRVERLVDSLARRAR